jgi:hypothetical protein
MGNKSGMLACTIERDADTGLFLGHCLTFDLMESGQTEQVAWERLKAAVKAHIEHCYTNYQPGLEVTASREEWSKYAKFLGENRESLVVEEIEIDLKPPLVGVEPIWVQKVSNVHAPAYV